MLARALSATPWGIDARPVQVEVDIQNGLPQMQIVGLPDAAVRESRERVRSALRNCGFDLPPRAVTINLAPADLRKEGNHLDLAIAIALLAAYGALPAEALAGTLLCGELGLDGLMFKPAGYFVATFGSRFLDPLRQARLEAMRRALSSLRLVDATRAVEEGRVIHAGTGAVVPWEPAPMVIPVSPRLRDRVEGAEYEAALEAELATLSYRLRLPGETDRLSSSGRGAGPGQ